jgi:serine/threonine-protein kinase RsbW
MGPVDPLMFDDPSVAPVVLTLPADPGFVHIARTITSGVASRLELPYDAVDDLRIAVGEACNRLLALHPTGSSRLTVRLQPDELVLTVAISLDADTDEWPADGSSGTLSWRVIAGLADDAEEFRLQGEPSIVMRWRTLGTATR